MAFCPANGNLMVPSALERMLDARAHDRHLVLLTAGYVSGSAAIPMHDDVVKFVQAQVETLDRFGLRNYLVLSSDFPSHLRPRGAPANAGQYCQTALRPLSLCCAWASYGFQALSGSVNATSRGWPGMAVHHPWMLLLQRVWLISEATFRGYSVLSTDTDLHFSSSPSEIFAPWRWRGVGLLFQGDSGFPHSETPAERERRLHPELRLRPDARPEQMPRDVPVTCEFLGPAAAHGAPPCACSSSARRDVDATPPLQQQQGHSQGHGHPYRSPLAKALPQPTAAPIINVGLILARGLPAVARLFQWTAMTIRERLSNDVPPELRDATGMVLDFAVWEQDVMNEVRTAALCALNAAARCALHAAARCPRTPAATLSHDA